METEISSDFLDQVADFMTGSLELYDTELKRANVLNPLIEKLLNCDFEIKR